MSFGRANRADILSATAADGVPAPGRDGLGCPAGEYDAKDDASKSFAVAFAAIRGRVAAGGPGWEPHKRWPLYAKPLAIDLFCGLGGWTEGLLAEGYEVVGFDIEQHQYGDQHYLGSLVIQDVMTLHGSQFRHATLIVASPPCQAYSYRAMPWSRAKALPPPDNTLFDACFRIQREACEAAGRHVPMVVENVRGAQPWVGRSRWNYGPYHLWGDVPALLPYGIGVKVGGDWFSEEWAKSSSKSPARKAASAMIAKIPLPLSRHIAATYHPRQNAACVHNDHS